MFLTTFEGFLGSSRNSLGLYWWFLAARDGLENVKGTSRHLEAAGPGLPNGPTLVGLGVGEGVGRAEFGHG